jgi:AraC family transcriptional regulator
LDRQKDCPLGSKDRVWLRFKNRRPPHTGRQALTFPGFSAEYVAIPGSSEFSYKWTGTSHYVALHDLRLTDGETSIDDIGTIRQLDLRERLTFVPKGCEVSGWSRVSDRVNTFTALYYDSSILSEELDSSLSGEARPMVYFADAAARSTLGKIQSLLEDESPAHPLYAETLALLAAIEIDSLQRKGTAVRIPDSGGLSVAQESLVRDYIQENLHNSVSLSDLAELAQLSRFHFARAFKKTFGLPPHQFVLGLRLDQAKKILTSSDLPMERIAEEIGFGNQTQFAAAFRRAFGFTPTQFRRAHR